MSVTGMDSMSVHLPLLLSREGWKLIVKDVPRIRTDKNIFYSLSITKPPSAASPNIGTLKAAEAA